MFGRKKNKQAKANKKKRGFFHNADNDKLSSVIDETTPNSVLDIFDAQPKLAATVNGENKYIGLMLNADDPKIGGINKTRRKDDTIGDLIEAINQDRLQVYAPAELLDENKLIIIPTLKTLTTMSEYNVLTNDNLKYTIALISTNGDIGLTQATINFDEMQRFMNDPDVKGDDLLSDKHVIGNNKSDSLKQSDPKPAHEQTQGDNSNENDNNDDPLSALTDGLSDAIANKPAQNNNTGTDGIDESNIEADESVNNQESQANQQSEPANNLNTADNSMPFGDTSVQEAPVQNEQDQAANQPELVQDDQVNDVDYSNGISDDATTQEQENEAANSESDNDLDWSGDDSENYNDNQDYSDDGQADDTVVSPEDTYKAITRKFYSNDLDLQISTAPIDDLLNADNKFVPFDVKRGKGYLNEYLSQMANEANQQLKTEHETHKSIVRNMYYDLITKSAEDLTAKLDEDDDKNEIGKRKAAIVDSKNKQEDDSKFNAAVAAEKKKLEDEFNARVKKEGERAAQQAEASYKERFSGELDAKLSNVEANKHSDIERWYNEAMKELHTDQKAKAAALWDNLESIAIGKALNRYKALRKQEAKHESNWRKKMRDFANNHRKEAIAHDDLLKRELDADKRAKEMKERYERQINKLEAENQDRLEQSQKRLDDLQKQHELDLANVKTQIEAETSAKHAREIADLKLANDKQVSQLQFDLQDKNNQANDYKLKAESEKIKNKNLQTKLDTLDARKSQELSDRYKSQYNGQIEALKTNSQFLKDQAKESASQIKAIKHSKVVSNITVALLSIVLSSGATFGAMTMLNQNHANSQAKNRTTLTKSEVQDMIDSAKRNQQAQDQARRDQQAQDQANQQKAINDALDKFKKEQNDAQSKQSQGNQGQAGTNNGNVQH